MLRLPGCRLMQQVSVSRTALASQRSLAVKPLKGRATISGTLQFLRQSMLPLHHRLERSKLYINPVIHGPPKKLYAKTDKDRTYIEALTRRAVVMNRSNCLVVYKHREDGEPWYSTNLHALFDNPANKVSREQVVAVADLGYACAREEVFRRLADACEVTALQTIDIAMFQVDESVEPHLVEETLDALKALCEMGQLQSYGFQLSVAPYVYHTPPLKESGPWMMLPMTMEAEYLERAAYAEWVVYSISPTTAVPATYPMLDTDELGEDCKYTGSDEAKRKFTRIALDPLTLRFGGRAAVKYEAPRVLEARKIRVRKAGAQRAAAEERRRARARDSDSESETEVSDDEDADTGEELDMMTGLYGPDIEVPMGQMLDELCPALKSTPLLQDKALRVVMSVGVEALLIDAERSAMLGRLRLTPDDMLPSKATDDVFENFCLTVDTEQEEADEEPAQR